MAQAEKKKRGKLISFIVAGSVVAAIIATLLCMALIPFSFESSEYTEAQQTLHKYNETLKQAGNVAMYNYKFDNTCMFCHPYTWRIRVRIERIKESFE